jgi:O-antigen/teichoic acid export membrane protein
MIRNIVTVMRGTVIAQAVAVLILPVLTRLFDPAAFGHLQLYLSVLTMLIVLPSLRYDIAILRAEDTELPSLLSLCFRANIAVTALLLAVAYGGAALFPDGWLAQSPFPLWTPIAAMVATSVGQVLLYVAIRDERFSVNANSKVAQAVSYAGVGAALGVARIGNGGLVFADFLGRIAGLAWLCRWMRKRAPMSRIGCVSIRAVASRYREYPIVALPAVVINSAGITITPIMIYATFDVDAAGQYALVDRVMSLPIAVVATSVSQAFMGQLATAMRHGTEARTQFLSVIRWLAIVGILPTLLVILSAPTAFVLLFGSEWELAGRLAQLLAPAAFVGLITGGVNMTLSVVGRQKTQMAWNTARLATLIALWTTVPILNLTIVTSLALHSAVLVFANLFYLILCARALKHPLRETVLLNDRPITESSQKL